MKSSYVRKRLWPVLAAAVIGCLLYGVWQLVAVRRELARYKRSLVGQGAIFTIERLAPTFTPPSSNALPQLTSCLFRLEKCRENPSYWISLMRPIAPGKALLSWRSTAPWVDDATPVAWDTVIAGRRRNEPVLALAREALRLPSFNANLDYAGQFNSPMELLWSIRTCCQWLSVAVACDLHRDDRSNALANLNASISCVSLTSQEPLKLCQLVTLIMMPLAVASTWELLQAPGWSEAQLAGLQDHWTALNLTRSAIRSLEMERARTCSRIGKYRGSSAELPQFIGSLAFSRARGAIPSLSSGSGSDPFLTTVDRVSAWGQRSLEVSDVAGRQFAWRWYWSYLDERLFLELTEAQLKCLRSVQSGVSWAQARSKYGQAAEVLEPAARQDDQVLCFFGKRTLEAGDNFQLYLMRAEVSRQIVITAIALERYRTRYHRYPDELAMLNSDYLPKVPRDPIDGQPLRYRLNPDQTFTLYSVGDDAVDQGGNAEPRWDTKNLHWLAARDWVWPSPANAKDIAGAEAKKSRRGNR